MATFKVQGGLKLQGDLHPQGAKNEALQVLCAVLLTPEEVIMENVPNIRDVKILIDLLISDYLSAFRPIAVCVLFPCF